MGGQYIPNQVFLCNRKYDSFVVRSSQRGGKFINAVQYLISKRVVDGVVTRYGARGRDPDNLRADVTKVCRDDLELNPTCADLAQDYGLAVIPAIFSLAELNTLLAAPLDVLNRSPFKQLPGCRQSQFEAVHRPALQPLLIEPYV